MPNIGPGALKVRAYRHQRALEEVSNLNPLTDFYKKFGLDCSTKNIAVDLFLLGGQDMDIASMCKYCYLIHSTLSVCFRFNNFNVILQNLIHLIPIEIAI